MSERPKDRVALTLGKDVHDGIIANNSFRGEGTFVKVEEGATGNRFIDNSVTGGATTTGNVTNRGAKARSGWSRTLEANWPFPRPNQSTVPPSDSPMSQASTQFNGSRLKIERAKRHIIELNAHIQAFLKTDFCKLHIEPDLETGTNLLKLDSLAAVPPDFSLCVGDAVHNLRSSLDYVTTFIVGKDNTRITFPVRNERDKLASTESYGLVQKSCPKLATYILDVIQPYTGGDFKIWEITQLDNFDKHKLLIPVLSIQTVGGINAIDENKNELIDCSVSVSEGGVAKFVAFGKPAKITGYGKPTATILFPKGTPFENQSVVPTLLQLSELTLKAIESLETFCFGDVSNPNPIPT